MQQILFLISESSSKQAQWLPWKWQHFTFTKDVSSCFLSNREFFIGGWYRRPGTGCLLDVSVSCFSPPITGAWWLFLKFTAGGRTANQARLLTSVTTSRFTTATLTPRSGLTPEAWCCHATEQGQCGAEGREMSREEYMDKSCKWLSCFQILALPMNSQGSFKTIVSVGEQEKKPKLKARSLDLRIYHGESLGTFRLDSVQGGATMPTRLDWVICSCSWK